MDLSDHAPVYALVNLNKIYINTLWRLNSSILNNEQFVVHMKTEIKHYLKENDNGEVSPSVLWDACKAVLRGKIIAETTLAKKLRQEKFMKLQTKLKELEMKHKNIQVQRPGLMQEIGKIKEEINELHNVEIEKNLIFLKQRYYEAGSRSLKLLSYRLRKQQVDNTIYKIIDPKTKKNST